MSNGMRSLSASATAPNVPELMCGGVVWRVGVSCVRVRVLLWAICSVRRVMAPRATLEQLHRVWASFAVFRDEGGRRWRVVAGRGTNAEGRRALCRAVDMARSFSSRLLARESMLAERIMAQAGSTRANRRGQVHRSNEKGHE